MASNKNKIAVSFTLPITCHICLGKVKKPVICPNQHVFCKVCMEYWLERSDHCPACRVPITPETPMRPILGGLDFQQEKLPEKSTREMRRTRMEVFFREYEDEIERCQRQIEFLEEENKILSAQVSKIPQDEQNHIHANQSLEMETSHLKVLTNKLDEMTEMYEQLKKETKSLKQENRLQKEENGKLNIENHKLKHEVVSRSPRRFGRTTVLAMESQLEKYKKENSALQKALEKSDAYIEDLEKELDKYKEFFTKTDSETHVQGARSTRGDNGGGDVKLKLKFLKKPDHQKSNYRSSESSGKNDTFELEMPSPMQTPGSKSMRKLAIHESSSDDEEDCFMSNDQLRDKKPKISNKLSLKPKINDTQDSEMFLDDTLESRITDKEDVTLELPSPVNSAKKRLKFSNSEFDDDDSRGANVELKSCDLMMNKQVPAAAFNQTQHSGTLFSTAAAIPSSFLTSQPVLSGFLTQKPVSSGLNTVAPVSYTHGNPMASSTYLPLSINPPQNVQSATVRFSSSNTSGMSASNNTQQSGGISGLYGRDGPGEVDLNASTTADIEDCMKIFEEAEKKVGTRISQSSSVLSESSGSNQFRPFGSAMETYTNSDKTGLHLTQNHFHSSLPLNTTPSYNFTQSQPIPQGDNLK